MGSITESTFTKFVNAAIKNIERSNAPAEKTVSDNFMHAILGLADESGELVKILKDMLYYSKPQSTTEIIAELGDLFWFYMLGVKYLAELAKTTPSCVLLSILKVNIAKLEARYKIESGYSKQQALVRNIPAEQKAVSEIIKKYLPELPESI